MIYTCVSTKNEELLLGINRYSREPKGSNEKSEGAFKLQALVPDSFVYAIRSFECLQIEWEAYTSFWIIPTSLVYIPFKEMEKKRKDSTLTTEPAIYNSNKHFKKKVV